MCEEHAMPEIGWGGLGRAGSYDAGAHSDAAHVGRTTDAGPPGEATGGVSSSLAAAIDGARNLTTAQREAAYTVAAHIVPGDSTTERALLDVIGRDIGAREASDGSSTLESLARMATTPRHAKLDTADADLSGPELMRQTVRHLADPLRITQGEYKGTCSAATMSFLLVNQDPAEYARIMEGLTSKEGKVGLRGGGALELLKNSIPGEASGRADIDRLLQSSLMDRANLFPFDYDNPNDDGGLVAVLGGDSAVAVRGFDELYSDITGKGYWGVSSYVSDTGSVAARAALAVDKGESVAVLTGFGGTFNFHWLSLESVQRDESGKPRSVVLRNPWGWDDGSGEPPRTSLGNGLIRMKYEDFEGMVHGAVLPKDKVPGSVREERPLGVRAEAHSKYGAGAAVTYNPNRRVSGDVAVTRTEDGRAHGSVGATVYLSDLAVSPTVGAHYHYTAGGAGKDSEHAVEGRVGVDYTAEDGFNAGVWAGVNTTLNGGPPKVEGTAGAYVGWRF
jgi:hypothetical protein